MKPPDADTLEQMIRTAMKANDWSTVADLEPRLDALDIPKPIPDMLTAALYYASLGLHVFPLQPGLKIPYKGTRGCKDATLDPATIKAWFTRRPASNLAIATGHTIDVIDIDGPGGVKSWANLDDLPPVLGVVSTPRAGGTHLYIAATGQGNRAAIAEGIDYRGAGGYVVAPPSVNAEGKAYRWRTLIQLPEAMAA